MYSQVAASDAIALSAAGEIWLLDVREDHEWAAGHAPQAHHIPMNALGARQDELPSESAILVICHTGGRSALVTDALERAGYEAANVEGGMAEWQALGGEVVASAGGTGTVV